MKGMETNAPYRPKWQTPVAIAICAAGVLWGLFGLGTALDGAGDPFDHGSRPSPIADIVAEAGVFLSPFVLAGGLILYTRNFKKPPV